MASDVRLDGAAVVVEGKWTRLETWDLMLDGPGRRTRGDGQRRALVHASDDSLRVNYRGDYPRGVTVEGHVQMPDSVTVGTEGGPEPGPARPAAPAKTWKSELESGQEPMKALLEVMRGRTPLLSPAPRDRGGGATVAPVRPPEAHFNVHLATEFHDAVTAGDVLLREGDSVASLKGLVARLMARVVALEEQVDRLTGDATEPGAG